MADETPKTTTPTAPKTPDASKLPEGIEAQTGQAAPATKAAGDAERKKAVEAAGFVLVKKNPHVVSIDEFETGDFKIGRTPVAVPTDQVEAICAHKDEYGRQYVVKA